MTCANVCLSLARIDKAAERPCGTNYRLGQRAFTQNWRRVRLTGVGRSATVKSVRELPDRRRAQNPTPATRSALSGQSGVAVTGPPQHSSAGRERPAGPVAPAGDKLPRCVVGLDLQSLSWSMEENNEALRFRTVR